MSCPDMGWGGTVCIKRNERSLEMPCTQCCISVLILALRLACGLKLPSIYVSSPLLRFYFLFICSFGLCNTIISSTLYDLTLSQCSAMLTQIATKWPWNISVFLLKFSWSDSECDEAELITHSMDLIAIWSSLDLGETEAVRMEEYFCSPFIPLWELSNYHRLPWEHRSLPLIAPCLLLQSLMNILNHMASPLTAQGKVKS